MISNWLNLKRHLSRAMGALALAGAVATTATTAFAAPAAGTAIGNQTSATYTDASNTPRTVTSNVVTAIVQQVASLTLTQSASRTVSVGSQVSYPLTLTNSGNGTDTFNLGAQFRLLGRDPLGDTQEAWPPKGGKRWEIA